MDGKLIKENLRGRAVLAKLSLAGFSLKAGQVVSHHLGNVGDEEPDQILRVIRY